MVYISNISVFILYTILMLGGYLSYNDKTPKDILNVILIDQNNYPFLLGTLI